MGFNTCNKFFLHATSRFSQVRPPFLKGKLLHNDDNCIYELYICLTYILGKKPTPLLVTRETVKFCGKP